MRSADGCLLAGAKVFRKGKVSIGTFDQILEAEDSGICAPEHTRQMVSLPVTG